MSLMESVFGSPGIGAATNAAQGLIGQSYQNQLEQQMLDMRAQQYNMALANSMAQTKGAIASSAYQKAVKPFNPNNSPAYTMPMSNLVTLWRAKFGDEWVEVFEEEFWQDARVRMTRAGMFEEAQGWFRLKEDV